MTLTVNTGGKNWTILHFKIAGTPFGVYRWNRNNVRGIVFRVGPLGHFQVQAYRMKVFGHSSRRDGRRGRHGLAVHFWGIAGRRRKRGIDIGVIL